MPNFETDPTPPNNLAILYCTADLMLGSPIHSTAEALGLVAYPVRSLEKLESRLATYQGRCAFVADLDAGPIAIELIRALTTTHPAIPTIAFGPHVDETAFRLAEEAGADHMMPRGQFVRNLPEILRMLATSNFSQARTHPVADDESQ
jgi:hypothetical protein